MNDKLENLTPDDKLVVESKDQHITPLGDDIWPDQIYDRPNVGNFDYGNSKMLADELNSIRLSNTAIFTSKILEKVEPLCTAQSGNILDKQAEFKALRDVIGARVQLFDYQVRIRKVEIGFDSRLQQVDQPVSKLVSKDGLSTRVDVHQKILDVSQIDRLNDSPVAQKQFIQTNCRDDYPGLSLENDSMKGFDYPRALHPETAELINVYCEMTRQSPIAQKLVPRDECYSETDLHWIQKYADWHHDAIIKRIVADELKYNIGDYLRTGDVRLEEDKGFFISDSKGVVKIDFVKVFNGPDDYEPIHECNKRHFTSDTISLKIPMTFEIPRTRFSKIPLLRPERKPYVYYGTNGITKDGNGFWRELQANDDMLESEFSSETIVEVETKFINSYIKTNLQPGLHAEATQICKLFRVKGGSLTGIQYNSARSKLLEFCKGYSKTPHAIEVMQFYRWIIGNCVKKVTRKTENGKITGSGYSATYAAFSNMTKGVIGEIDHVVSNHTKLFNQLWNFVQSFGPDPTCKQNYDILVSELVTAEYVGIFQKDIVKSRGLSYRKFLGTQFNRWYQMLFDIMKPAVIVAADQIKKKRDNKSKRKPRGSFSHVNVLRDKVVPMLNLSDSHVTLDRPAGLQSGRDVPLLEAADRMITQINTLMGRVAPGIKPVQNLTLRHQLVTRHRDGSLRSIVVPANRALRRVITNYGNDADGNKVSEGTWHPAAVNKTIIEETQDEKNPTRIELVKHKMQFRTIYQEREVPNMVKTVRDSIDFYGPSRDAGLRKKWFAFELETKVPGVEALGNAYAATATIGIDDDDFRQVFSSNQVYNTLEMIQIDSDVLRDAGREVCQLYVKNRESWNSLADHIIVDIVDMIYINDYKPYHNIKFKIHKDENGNDVTELSVYADKPTTVDIPINVISSKKMLPVKSKLSGGKV